MKFTGNISAFELMQGGVWEALSWIKNLGMSTKMKQTLCSLGLLLKISETNCLEMGNIIDTCKLRLHESGDVYIIMVGGK